MLNSTMYTMCIASIQSYQSLNEFVDLLSLSSFNKEL